MTSLALGMPAIRRAPGTMPPTEGRPDVAGLVDRFGRTARDLRISVTEKCSLRCTYCMPEQGLPAIPREDLLTPAEIARLVGIGVRDLGVHDVRFTGGEPLMRADLAEIISRSSAVAGDASISITTNGIGLDHRIRELVAAGLTRINISLDTVDRDHFARLTRRDRLPAVFAGIEAAKAAGLTPLKINAVLMRDTLAGAADLLEWALANGVRLRFIEQMPLDADEAWARDNMVDAAELLDVLGARFTLSRPHREDPSSPAEEWVVGALPGVSQVPGPTPRSPDDSSESAGGPAGKQPEGRRELGTGLGTGLGKDLGTVGIIASVTRSFCEACDRTRITAEGTVRSCLFGDDETDLRALLRGSSSDAEIADWWRAAMWGKQAGHGMSLPGFRRPQRSMGAIGG